MRTPLSAPATTPSERTAPAVGPVRRAWAPTCPSGTTGHTSGPGCPGSGTRPASSGWGAPIGHHALAREDRAAYPDTTGPDTTGPATTGPDTTGPDTTGPDTTGPDTGTIVSGRGAGRSSPRTPGAAAGDHPPTASDVPFGLPILAELPDLAQVLQALHDADGAALRALIGVARILGDDTVRRVSGVSIEHWIGIVACHTRMDRRFLLRTARLLQRFPALQAAAAGGEITYSQVRALSLALRGTPRAFDAELDATIAAAAPALQGADPDAIVTQVRRTIERLVAAVQPAGNVEGPPEDLPVEAPISPYLALQPRLDGSGGRVSGELDALGLAVLDAATAPRPGQLDGDIGVGGIRAANLLTRLATHGPSECPDPSPPPSAPDPVEPAAAPVGSADCGDQASATGSSTLPLHLIVRIELRTLLGLDDTPADVLTRLIGGRLRLDAPTARRLVTSKGAVARSIIVDDQGQALGVGRRTRLPPGWLQEALMAVHDTCTGPLCDRPARPADLDHAHPWVPDPGTGAGGATDVDNLGPLCASTNRAIAREGWTAEPLGAGRRRWTHRRSGLQITTVPRTWAPPPRAGPDP